MPFWLGLEECVGVCWITPANEDLCQIQDRYLRKVGEAHLHQGSKNWLPSGHLRLKNPVWRVKNPFSGQFGDWKLPFCGLVGDQTFFKADNADADRTWSRKVFDRRLCRSKMQRELAVRPRRSCLRVNPPPVSRCLPWDSPSETIWALWGGENIVRAVTVSLRGTLSPHESFSVGVWVEQVPQFGQRRPAFGQRRRRNRRIRRRRFKGGRREGASSKEEESSKEPV